VGARLDHRARHAGLSIVAERRTVDAPPYPHAVDGSSERTIIRHGAHGVRATEDHVVVEAPVEFRLGDVPIAVLMRTPGRDAELLLGFAITEGIVLVPDEVAAVRPIGAVGDDRWELVLADGVDVDPEQFRRNLYTTSSCGVCGKASIDAVRVAARPLPPGPVVDPAVVLDLPHRMRATQTEFERTGGVHAAAAFTAEGQLIDLCEDVGRHNAVDKLVGTLARTRWPLGDVVLVVSGRVSFEIVQKAAVAGIPIVAGVSAASSLAADLGEELGMTVIGFVRPDGFNVYAGPTRLSDPAGR
jgi:FdhD protein